MRTIAILLLSCWACLGAQRLIVCDGNSITAASTSGIASNAWPAVLQRLLTTNSLIVTNIAVSGQNLHDMTNDLATQVFPLATNNGLQSVYICWELVNTWRAASGGVGTDAASNMTAVEAERMVSNLCTRVRSAGFLVIVANDFHDDYPYETTAMSDLVQANWASYADGFMQLDLQSLRDDATANDGLHLGDTGEAIVAGVAETSVRSLLGIGVRRVLSVNSARVGRIQGP